MSVEIKFVGELSRVHARPGDRFALHLDQHVTPQMVENIQAAWRQFLGEDAANSAKLLVLPKNARLVTVSAA